MQTIRLWFCDFWHAETEDSIRSQNELFRILKRRFNIILDPNEPEFLIYSCFGVRFLQYCCARIFYTGESSRSQVSEYDFAISYEHDISERIFRFPFYALGDLSCLLQPRNVTKTVLEKTGFCNFIYKNPRGKERNLFFQMLSEYKKVDSVGSLYNNTAAYGLAMRQDSDWQASKIEFIRHYKFTIAFENKSAPGYVTEKISDALMAGSVPIYWGSQSIAEDFNSEAFINCHDFSNFEAVIRHIIEVDNDDTLYRGYLSASPFCDNKLPQHANHELVLDFFEASFENPPKKLAATSYNSKFLLWCPNFLRKVIIFQRRGFLWDILESRPIFQNVISIIRWLGNLLHTKRKGHIT